MAGQQVIVSVLADTRRFNTAMAGTDRTLQRFQNSLRSVNRVGVLAFGALAIAASQFTISAVRAAEEAEAIDRKLVNQTRNIKRFGDQYKVVSDRLIAFAEVAQRQLGVDDDLVKSTQVILLTFKDLAKTAEVAGGAFDRATIAAFNLAEQGFGTAESNAIQLGKALEDPIKGITSLTRSGVTFTKQQREQIKNFVEAGKKAEAFALILDVIDTQSANAGIAGVTATQKLATAWDNFQEVFGSKLLPKLVPIIDELTEALYALSESEDFDELVQAFADAIAQLAKELPGVVKGLGKLLKFMNDNNISFLDAIVAVAGFQAVLGFFSGSIFNAYLTSLLTSARRNKSWASEMRVLDEALGGASSAVKFHEREIRRLEKKQKSNVGLTKEQTKELKHHREELKKNADGLKTYTDRYNGLTTEMERNNKVIDDNTGKVRTNAGWWGRLTDIFENNKVFSTVAKLLGKISGWLLVIEGALKLGTGFVEGFTEKWKEFEEQNPNTIRNLETLGTIFSGIFGFALELVNGLFFALDALLGLLEPVGKWLGEDFAESLGFVLNLVSSIVDGIKFITGWQPAADTRMPKETYIGPTPSTTPTVNNTNSGNTVYNNTVNVQSLVPTAETGRVVANSLQKYQRSGGKAILT
jgi:hypothetical protein